MFRKWKTNAVGEQISAEMYPNRIIYMATP